MIRPVFGFKQAVGFEEELFKDLKVFPNPNNGVFIIKGEFAEATLFDILGNKFLEIPGKLDETEIKVPEEKKGLYLLKILKEGKQKTYKIIIR